MAKISVSQLKALVRYIAAIWPLVMQFIEMAEAAGGTGAAKLAAVRAALERVWDSSIAFADAWDNKLKPAVEAIVALWNMLGKFKKG